MALQERKSGRILITNDNEARTKLLEGVKLAAEAVGVTYGPRGRNVIFENTIGLPTVTRDGATVAKQVYFSDAATNMGAQLVMEASQTTERVAGDATSATALLTYHWSQLGAQEIAAGVHPMVVSRRISDDADRLLEELERLAKPTKKGQLEQVATVSSGDPLLGKLIAEAVEHVGPEGGIIAEQAMTDSVEREYANGYYLQTGFQALQQGRKEMISPAVIVSIKRLTSIADAAELLTKTAQIMGITPQAMQSGNIPRILLVGDISGDAYNVIVDNVNRGQVDAIIIRTPATYGEMGRQLLEDIAIYANCKPVTEATNLRAFNEDYVGGVDRVMASKMETTIFGDNDRDTVQERITALRDQLKEEIGDAVAEKLRDRIAKLEGRIALFRIGGATDTEKEEVSFRVDDAILATRAAAAHGVVAGGGVTLLALSKTEGIDPITVSALQALFKRLFENAGLPGEVYLANAEDLAEGYGWNLRGLKKGVVSMEKEGILDAKLAIEQVIKNASSIASKVLSVGAELVFEVKEG